MRPEGVWRDDDGAQAERAAAEDQPSDNLIPSGRSVCDLQQFFSHAGFNL